MYVYEPVCISYTVYTHMFNRVYSISIHIGLRLMHIIHLSSPSTLWCGGPGHPQLDSKHHIIRATYVEIINGITNKPPWFQHLFHANNLGGFGFGNGEAVKTWLRLKQMQQRHHHQPRPMHQKRSCPPSSGPSNSASILAICWQGWKAHSQLPCTDNRNKSSSKETAGNPFLLQVWEQNKCKKLSFWGSSTHILCWHLLSNLESLVQESPTSIINHQRWSSPMEQWEQRTFPLQVLRGDVQLCLNPPGKWSSCRRKNERLAA